MKRVIIVFVIIVTFVMTIGIVGCKKNTLKYKVLYYKSEHSGFQNAFYHSDKSYGDTGYCRETSKLIKSYEELKQLCDEYNSPAFSKDSKQYDSELNQLIRSFDSNYFVKKSLIICFGTGGIGGPLQSGKVKNITIEENILLINYKNKDSNKDSIAAIINDPWVLIIEVNQEEVKDVVQTKIIWK